jgi:hypothetical protein
MANKPEYDGYEELIDVFDQAVRRCAVDKGRSRHAINGEVLLGQPVMKIQDLLEDVALGFPLGQAFKKMTEALKMKDWSRARLEYLDAMVYIGCAIIHGDIKDSYNPMINVEEELKDRNV